MEERDSFSGSVGVISGSCSAVRWLGIAPSTLVDWLAVSTAVSWTAGGLRPLSSLVQSSTTGPVPGAASGPASANS